MENAISQIKLYLLLGANLTGAAVLLFLLLHHLKLVQDDFSSPVNRGVVTETIDTAKTKSVSMPTKGTAKQDTVKKATPSADTSRKASQSDLKKKSGNDKSVNEAEGVSFYEIILLMLISGGLGGILCNLRGFFMHYRSEEQSFPRHLEIPYYVRPFMGAGAGIFIYFVANFLITSLTVEYKANVPFQGMVSFIALAMLAGFGSLEFFQRLKETALTLFGQKPEKDRWQKLDDLFALYKKGVLTEAEYLTEKTKLLNQSSDAESRGELFIPKPK